MRFKTGAALISALFLLSPAAMSAEWVYGRVDLVEDYRAFNADLGILITLAGTTYTSGGSAQATCTQRYRVVVGAESVTADIQKAALAMLLAARASADTVRIFVNPSNTYGGNYCAVQIVAVGNY